MAIFKNRDRSKRSSVKAYHESAMLSAESTFFCADIQEPEGRVIAAYHSYRDHMDTFGAVPYTLPEFTKRFTKRMKKAGFTV